MLRGVEGWLLGRDETEGRLEEEELKNLAEEVEENWRVEREGESL
jgi:hypothetical protein